MIKETLQMLLNQGSWIDYSELTSWLKVNTGILREAVGSAQRKRKLQSDVGVICFPDGGKD